MRKRLLQRRGHAQIAVCLSVCSLASWPTHQGQSCGQRSRSCSAEENVTMFRFKHEFRFDLNQSSVASDRCRCESRRTSGPSRLANSASERARKRPLARSVSAVCLTPPCFKQNDVIFHKSNKQRPPHAFWWVMWWPGRGWTTRLETWEFVGR